MGYLIMFLFGMVFGLDIGIFAVCVALEEDEE